MSCCCVCEAGKSNHIIMSMYRQETCLTLTTNLIACYLVRLEVKRLLHRNVWEMFIVLYTPHGESYKCVFSLLWHLMDFTMIYKFYAISIVLELIQETVTTLSVQTYYSKRFR